MPFSNEALARKIFDEIWKGGNLALIDELYTEDFVCHLEPDEDWEGRDAVRDAVNLIRGTFNDYEERIEDIVSNGDKIAVRSTMSGTFRESASEEVGAGGRRVSTLAISLFRIANGQIAEQWEVVNMQGIFRQLGFISNPA